MSPQILSQVTNEILDHVVIAKKRAMNQDYEGARIELAQAETGLSEAKRVLSVIYGDKSTHLNPVISACERRIKLTEETLP
nr:hypothetical protein [uncultured archaeon]AQS34159.1 hypothetical protein [uncultured archaeon]